MNRLSTIACAALMSSMTVGTSSCYALAETIAGALVLASSPFSMKTTSLLTLGACGVLSSLIVDFPSKRTWNPLSEDNSNNNKSSSFDFFRPYLFVDTFSTLCSFIAPLPLLILFAIW